MDLVLWISPNRGQGQKPENVRGGVIYAWSLHFLIVNQDSLGSRAAGVQMYKSQKPNLHLNLSLSCS